MGFRVNAASTGRKLCIFLALAATGVCAADAVPGDALAELPDIEAVALSPNGRGLAYFTPRNGRMHLVIEDLGASGATVLVPPVEGMNFKWVRWANDERLVFALDFQAKRGFSDTDETRLLAIDKDGSNISSIIQNATRVEIGSHIEAPMPPPLRQDDVVDWLPGDHDHILISLDADHDDRHEVRKVNVNDGDYDIVQVGLPGMRNHLTDDDNQVRFSWGSRRDRPVARYQRADGEWKNVSDTGWWQAGFLPVAMDAGSDVALVKGYDEQGKLCLRRINLVSGAVIETVFEPSSDEDTRVFLDPSDRQVLGVSFGDQSPQDRYFDDNMATLKRTIDTALPAAPNRIVSMSNDRRQLVVYAANALDPGVFYLWDRDAKSLELIGKNTTTELPAFN